MELNGRVITYLYDTQRTTLRQVTSGQNRKTVEYMGSLMVEGAASILFTGEGRIYKVHAPLGKIWMYEYWLKDHLGNTRVSFLADSSDAMPNQYKDYYPFGLEHGHPDWYLDTDNRYLYNGKELQTDFDLNWYDYGFRMYDPSIGRFYTVDLLAEYYDFQSPYVCAANNPVTFIDYLGLGADGPDLNEGGIYHSFSPPGGSNGGFNQWDFSSFGSSYNDSSYTNYNLSYTSNSWLNTQNNDLINTVGNALYTFSSIGSLWDIYNNFGYNHTSYPTTKGKMKLFSDFAGRVKSQQALKYLSKSKAVKTFGNLGTGLMVGQSVFNIFYKKDRTILNATDGVVGVLGLTNSALLRWTSLGSEAIGSFVAIYGYARLLYDFVAVPNINLYKHNIMNNKYPLEGVYNPQTGMWDTAPFGWY